MLPAPNAGQSCRIWSSSNPKIGGGHEQPTLSSVVAEDGVANACRGGELVHGVLGERSKPSIAAAGSEGQIGVSRVTFVTAMVTSKVPSVYSLQLQARRHRNCMEATPLLIPFLQSSELWPVFRSTKPHHADDNWPSIV